MPGKHFQRWEVPVPAVPDGIAIIGFDPGRETYLQRPSWQHDFDLTYTKFT